MQAERQPRYKRLPAISFTYNLCCKASETSTTLRVTPGDSVHLPPALQTKPNVSHVTSDSQRFGLLTSYVAKQAERQPRYKRLPAIRFTYNLCCKASETSATLRVTPGDSVHLPPALQTKPNVSHVASVSQRFGSLTGCVTKRAIGQQRDE